MSVSLRLFLLIIITCVAVVSFAILTAVYFSSDHLEQELEKELNGIAEVISINTTAALAFRDHKLAERNLKTLSANPDVTFACLYTSDKKLFASHGMQEHPQCLETFIPIHYSKDDAYQTVVKEIKQGTFDIGHIVIASDEKKLDAYVSNLIQIAFMIISGSVIIIGVLAWRIQHTVSRPISELVESIDFKNMPEIEYQKAHSYDDLVKLKAGIHYLMHSLIELKQNQVLAQDNMERVLGYLDYEIGEKHAKERILHNSARLGFTLENPDIIIEQSKETLEQSRTLLDCIRYVQSHLRKTETHNLFTKEEEHIKPLDYMRTLLGSHAHLKFEEVGDLTKLNLSKELYDEIAGFFNNIMQDQLIGKATFRLFICTDDHVCFTLASEHSMLSTYDKELNYSSFLDMDDPKLRSHFFKISFLSVFSGYETEIKIGTSKIECRMNRIQNDQKALIQKEKEHLTQVDHLSKISENSSSIPLQMADFMYDMQDDNLGELYYNINKISDPQLKHQLLILLETLIQKENTHDDELGCKKH